MSVPDWVWEWGQEKFDMKNPASRISDYLTAKIMEESAPSEVVRLQKSDKKKQPDNGYKDKGTAWVARHAGYCRLCEEHYPAGTNLVLHDGLRSHMECFNKMKRKQQRADVKGGDAE